MTVLAFGTYLRESRDLATNTIGYYLSAVCDILKIVFDLNVDPWELKALKSNLFLEKPPNSPRIPDWDVFKVNFLLGSSKYIFCHCPIYLFVLKRLFVLFD